MSASNHSLAAQAQFVEDVAPAFTTIPPRSPASGVVMSIPHAGRAYPLDFVRQSRLAPMALRRSEDAFVDLLMEPAAAYGVAMLVAHFPRAYLDVNREPYELDPRMFVGRLPPFSNTRSLRVVGGLGAIPRIVGEGQEIYTRPIPVAEALRRIETFHRPYHQALRGLLASAQAQGPHAVLLDVHSMPAIGLEREPQPRPDIVLGDRFGTSAGAEVVQCLEALLTREGFRVAWNRPYAGGYITEHYGQPQAGRHAVQIEINRALYMDERRIEMSGDFPAVRDALTRALSRFSAACATSAPDFRHAAE
jgi:N-formylglutamate amidohydrolase